MRAAGLGSMSRMGQEEQEEEEQQQDGPGRAGCVHMHIEFQSITRLCNV